MKWMLTSILVNGMGGDYEVVVRVKHHDNALIDSCPITMNSDANKSMTRGIYSCLDKPSRSCFTEALFAR
jgi:hypothetical protein